MASSGLKVHFDLLKEEHQCLLAKYSELQRVQGSISNKNGLAAQLQTLVTEIYKKEMLSDLELIVQQKIYKSHRFLLKARTNYWNEIESNNRIELPDISIKIFDIIYHWLYTDAFDSSISDQDLLKVADQACKYKFSGLQDICELWLRSRLDVSNCVEIFQFAENNGLTILSEQCSTLVGSRWNEFTKEHFSQLSGSLLYRLLKGNAENVLRSIIQLNREDVLFLYFIDNESKLKSVLNDKKLEVFPLEEALSLKFFPLAQQLVQHGADVNSTYAAGDQSSLLMRMIRSGNVEALEFLRKNNVNINGVQDNLKQMTPLQEICSSQRLESELINWLRDSIPQFDVNFSAGDSRSPLSIACLNSSQNAINLVEILLNNRANPNLSDFDGYFPLFHALCVRKSTQIAEKLIEFKANVDAKSGNDPLLHLLIKEAESFYFLLRHGPNLEALDSNGMTILQHAIDSYKTAGPSGLEIIKALAEAGSKLDSKDSEERTALHMAIQTDTKIVEALTKFLSGFAWDSRDQEGKTVLQLAVEKKELASAQALINVGAPINCHLDGESLLIETLKRQDDEGSVFLLKNNADFHVKDSYGRSILELALTNGLTETIKSLCARGINIDDRTFTGYTVLEKALSGGYFESALLLVKNGCDLESWASCDDGEQTLLHYMMDQGNQKAAVFLIENGASVNSMKKFKNEEENDRQSLLHLAVGWGLTQVAEALVQHSANLNFQDRDDRTPCHIAVREGNREALEILLSAEEVAFISIRDKLGQTPLSLAISRKDHKAAAAIVARQPHAALQTNGNGENLLHVAVRSNDLESVLFLLGTHTDPTRTTQDQMRRTALHMAASIENELIMRNLILAGCVIDARSADGSTALHEALKARRANLAAILLENGAASDILDERGECAYLTAVRCGSLDCLRVLVEHRALTGPVINRKWAESSSPQVPSCREESVLHLCAALSTEKIERGTTAADLVDLILRHEEKTMSEKEFGLFVDSKDKLGNTALLTAFMNGNPAVCRSLLKRGATMGVKNNEGLTIFTYETPTKQLLFGLLDSLEKEPRWSDGDFCDCGAKFSITQRKHHCRHCGRVVCAPCSAISMPIAKFGEEKKVRVCSLCSIVLTEGGGRF